ncbi:hypothetical protein M8994_14495 [Brucella sp. 21LCYQ03]|nr:hypothetical protein [Brucella sp. 21LCYQ03]
MSQTGDFSREIAEGFLGEVMVHQVATRREILTYIEKMLGELIAMAKNTDQQMLVYMMDMALLEAKEHRNLRKSAEKTYTY